MNEFEYGMRNAPFCVCIGKQYNTIMPALQTIHVIPISEDHVHVKNITRLDLPTASQNEILMT